MDGVADGVNQIFYYLQQQYDFTRMIVTMALVLARLLMVVQLTPFLGGKNAPPEVKMGVGIALSLIAFPIVQDKIDGPLPIDAIGFSIMMLKEVFVGLVIGFIGAQLFYAVEMAGQFINLVNGTNMVQLMVPELHERSSAFGDLNYQLLLALFLAFNGHHVFIDGLFQSFAVVPINRFPDFSMGLWPLMDLGMRIMADIFIVAANIAAPIAIACLVTDLTFGLLNRIAPQINAYFLSMPVKAMAGCAMFFVGLPMILVIFEEYSASMLQLLTDVLRLFQ
ncbi:MAG: flagellar biosynthetic protein FliR [Deltaproteobacteria bacterium]|nr:flagellar biosynthetic protein FliR [Deltaproteobacteria bacterium]